MSTDCCDGVTGAAHRDYRPKILSFRDVGLNIWYKDFISILFSDLAPSITRLPDPFLAGDLETLTASNLLEMLWVSRATDFFAGRLIEGFTVTVDFKREIAFGRAWAVKITESSTGSNFRIVKFVDLLMTTNIFEISFLSPDKMGLLGFILCQDFGMPVKGRANPRSITTEAICGSIISTSSS